jgi:hypothetical protein
MNPPRVLSFRTRRERMVPRTELRVRVHGIDLQMTLRDVSAGGLSIVCARPFRAGALHRLVVNAPDGLSITFVATTVYSRPATDAPGELQFVTGWSFADGAHEDGTVELLLAAAKGEPTDPPRDIA